LIMNSSLKSMRFILLIFHRWWIEINGLHLANVSSMMN